MGVSTQPKNATAHPGLRAMGDPTEIAEAAARKKKKKAKQVERVCAAAEKSSISKDIAAFEDDLQRKVDEAESTQVKRPRTVQGRRSEFIS